jgi:large subunit ribosomal protein L1
MAKKAELLEELKKLDKKTTLTLRNTIAEIEAAIADVGQPTAAADPSTAETATEPEADAEPTDARYAKSGKRSKKHEESVQAEIAKEERKTTAPDEPVEKKGPAPATRPLIERRSKKYQAAAKNVDKAKLYSLAEAMELATKTSTTKFDSTVEMHVRLGVDPRQADQNIRATVNLPNGSGKTIRVAVLVPEADIDAAKTAGADIAGEDSFLQQLAKGQIDFDTLITTPAQMPKLGKYARILGPKGLMPNPKAGTVTNNITSAVREAKAGKVEYRVDKQSIIHLGIGKVSFGAKRLEENATTFINSLNANKPASLKGSYIISASVSTSMGPGIKLDL